MRDKNLQIFIAEFGEATYRASVPERILQRYERVLPAQWLRYWREEGWCGYADGLFWTVNPEEYQDLADMWLSGTQLEMIDRYHVVARSAFGDLYVWGERNHRSFTIACPINSLIALEGQLHTEARDPDVAARVFFSSRMRRSLDMYDDVQQGLFDQALRRLGPLAPDEVYGFEPALVLGGRRRVENLSKLNLFVHLAVLRDLAEPQVPFGGIDPGPR